MRFLKSTILLLSLLTLFSFAKNSDAVYPVAGRRKSMLGALVFFILAFFGTLSFVSPAYGAVTVRPMLNTGLVGYWSMDEGSGTNVGDMSGNGNDGTLTDLSIDEFSTTEGWTEYQITGSVANRAYQLQITNISDPYTGDNITDFSAGANTYLEIRYKNYTNGPSDIRLYYREHADCNLSYSETCAQNFPITVDTEWHILSAEITDAEWIDGDGNIDYLRLDLNNASTTGTMEIDYIRFFIDGDWQDGKRGKAVNFDGTDDRVVLGDPAILDLNTNFTISTWVKVNSFSSSNGGIVAKGVNTTLAIRADGNSGNCPSTNCLTFRILDSLDVNLEGSVDAVTNRWYHVAMVVGARGVGGLRGYIDGVERVTLDTSSIGDITSTNNWYVGYNDRNLTYFNGIIDEVRIYNRVLSGTEVANLYQSGSAKLKIPTNTGLVGYWSMDEGSGTKAGDMSGNGNTGTLSGTTLPTWWITGKRSKALDFTRGNPGDYSGSYIYVPSNDFVGMSALTASAWIYPDTNNLHIRIFEKSSNGDLTGIGDGWYLALNDDGGSVDNALWFGACYFGNRLFRRTANNVLVPNQWQYVTLTWDGSSNYSGVHIYVNGAEASYSSGQNGTSDRCDSQDELMLGSYWGEKALDGKMDEARIYNRALSATEVTDLYNSSGKRAEINSSQNDRMTSDLVGLWSFDGPDVSGTNAYDRSGQGNDGTITGATPTIGKAGQGMNFDGTSDDVDAGDMDELDGASAFTVSTWVNPSSLSDWRGIFSKYLNSNNLIMMQLSGSGLGENDDILVMVKNGSDNGSGRTNGNIIAVGVWHHLTMVYDGTQSTNADKLKFYLDGSAQVLTMSTVPSTAPNTSASVLIGRTGENANSFIGKLDEVRVYNRALSAAEVQQLYNMGR